MSQLSKVLFTDRHKVSEKRELLLEMFNHIPMKYILWDGKLWEFKGIGGGEWTFLYHEVERFQLIN